MQGLSPVDGFMDVKDGVDEMIKYLANEPSVGLFFVQQHAQASMPYLLNLKDKVVENIHEVTSHTEDIEDSIYVVRSMTECGLPIADEMIKEINKSLLVMSTSQPKKGLISNPTWGFPVGRGSSNQPAGFNNDRSTVQQDGRSSRSYLSAVFSSAKQKAAGLRWTQPYPVPESQRVPTLVDVEGDQLPLSSPLDDEPLNAITDLGSSEAHDLSSMLDNYNKFRSDREAKLEEWLKESEDHSR